MQYHSLQFQSRSAQKWAFVSRNIICGNQDIVYPIPLANFLVLNESRQNLQN